MATTEHLNDSDPKYPLLAADILGRHDRNEAEANITTAVRSFLTGTGLVKSDEIVEENPPAEGSSRAVDLTALDTFIEVKRRIGTAGSGEPNPDYVDQLDEYLAESEKKGRVRMGILTDGRYWLLRWPGAGSINTAPKPYGFTLENSADGWLPLYEWLRDNGLVPSESISVNRETISRALWARQSPLPPGFERFVGSLRRA